MQIERAALADALKICKAGLADKHPLTQLLCFWFRKNSLTTYNEVIGIELPLDDWFECDFEGGIPGALLLGLVENSRAKNATLEVDKGSLALKLAGARAKLPVIPVDDAVWWCPETSKGAVEIPIDSDLIAALDHSQLAASSGEYAATGVCFSQEDAGLFIYATDGKSMAYSELASCDLRKGEKVSVPHLFCGQIIARAEAGTLFIEEDRVVAAFESGLRICSRILEVKPLDYRAVLNRLLPEKFHKEAVVIPSLLTSALSRGAVLAVNGVERSSYETSQDRLEIFTKTDLGELREALPLESKHRGCSAFFDSAIIRRALNSADKFLLSEQCFVLLQGKKSGYVVTPMV